MNNEEQILEPKNKEKKKETLFDFIKYLVVAVLIVIPIRMFIAQPFIVSGESMYPTFLDRDYLIIDEISYLTGEPHRSDVIVFRYPNDTKRFFIKRIIALPNEELNIKDGVITIKNKENPEGFLYEEPYLKEQFKDSLSFKTGAKEYFVMGDNRSRSSDSRVWGSLPEKLVIGKAFFRLLPIKDISFMPGAY